MTTTARWLIVLSVAASIGVVAVLLVLFWPAAEETSAQEIADLIAADVEAARARFLNRRCQVKGSVLSTIAVKDDAEPYTMVYFKTTREIELQAQFATRDVPDLREGDEIVFRGLCQLCDPGVVYFDDCAMVSSRTP